ncbi:MAG: alpha-glucosidase [Corallococcus sp.]|nr:alpha-glucosidase [Corallococcus sp.]
MNNKWYKDSVFYQIYPRSYCDSNGDGIGDIKGIISKIDYISSLGVDAIWFSPLYASPNADYGYDISDYCEINPEYGTMEDFDEMTRLLHKKNIKVIMDLVINHTSDKHKWFVESRKSKDNPYREYYYWMDGKGKNGKRPPNNWTSFFLGKAWKYDSTTNQWYLHLFDQNQPDLNYSNPKVIEEIKSILHFWLKKGVDGFRCDVITLLSKTKGLPDGKKHLALTGKEHYIDGSHMVELLDELQRDALSQYDAFTVGESVMIDVPTALRYTDERHSVLNTVFAFDHMSADNYFGIKQFVRKFKLKILKDSLRKWQQGLYGKAWNTLYFENHDQARIVGRYCSDTIYREEGTKMLATVLMTLSGTPFVYQGQEIGMTSLHTLCESDYRDVETIRSLKTLRKVFSEEKSLKIMSYCSRDNARTPMQWNDGKNAGFSDADETWLKVNPRYTEINVESNEQDANSVLNYYRKLISLRKSIEVFRYGTYFDFYQHSNKLLVYLREYNGDKLLVLCNFSQKRTAFKPPKEITEEFELVTSNYTNTPSNIFQRFLQPYEGSVYRLKH